ncbi:P-loop containing nucleoside triphosphate hydrolase protein [Phascolomyces articulosus]|uniref:P-loop containing nucleoside triphosphate hydrolase protein n=1 Tax=Phascolomyces articulosus TaxID=60185 RepID=A0AAD5K0X5_9FUNG|nr:P-loop containing nucleoside triphosphate hydrolase protein [Phascolomyces articulosus]
MSTIKRKQEQPTTKTKKTKKQQVEKLPPKLERLQCVFSGLNTFCAFCDARLLTVLTWSRIQSAVPNVTMDDLAAINVILPDFIAFTLDESDNNATTEWIIQFGKLISKRVARQKQSEALQNKGDAWEYPTKKLDMKPDQIKKTVDTRNHRFQQGLNKFILACRKKGLDPETHLVNELKQYLPQPPENAHQQQVDPGQQPEDENLSQERSMHEMIHQMQVQKFYLGQLVNGACHRTFPEKMARFGELDPPIAKEISQALERKGITQLYTHQTEAIRELRNKNQHVIVATSTASGKSLIYQIPVLEKLLEDKSSRAMYIFPTKALAQDQMRALQEFIQSCPKLSNIKIATFDGDTPSDQRMHIRSTANVIFTNPDMLHHSILPNAKQWQWFLLSLKFVVVDELHIYNGLFGTNVAFIMRRLRRLCHHFGNDLIQFISCSATIRHPDQHMKLVFGVDNVKLIDEDGAPSGKKEFVVWNPPLLKPSDPHSDRRGAVAEGADILEYLLSHNIRTIAFCKVRKTCEMLMKHLRESLEKQNKLDMLKKVMSYRGGYMPHERRKIERQMFSGELLGVIATNALELGVDIGSLDAVLMVGMPWSASAMWQQSGRAGRRNADSLSMVITDQNPMDQYYAHHPTELFEKPLDEIHFEIEENVLVLENHLQCAAEELPIDTEKDQVYFGPRIKEICEQYFVSIGNQQYRPHPRFRPYPAQFVNIRNITEEIYTVIDVTSNRNIVLEEIEASRAAFEIYEGAIFIHQGKPYLVEELNVEKRYAKVHLTRVNWTTRQRDYTNVNVLTTSMAKPIGSPKNRRNTVGYGKVQIETVVFGYYKLDKSSRIIDSLEVYMDPVVRESTGIWADVNSTALAKLEDLGIDKMASIHAAAHVLISLLPSFTSSTTVDVRTECKSPHATRSRPPRIALYETQPNGIVRQAYQFFRDLVIMSVDQIQHCECEDGCPSCVHLASCSEHNILCSKPGALIILRSLLEMDIQEIGKNDDVISDKNDSSSKAVT